MLLCESVVEECFFLHGVLACSTLGIAVLAWLEGFGGLGTAAC